MDFRRQIVTCLFSMLRLSFETQKVKENYAIFNKNTLDFRNGILKCGIYPWSSHPKGNHMYRS